MSLLFKTKKFGRKLLNAEICNVKDNTNVINMT